MEVKVGQWARVVNDFYRNDFYRIYKEKCDTCGDVIITRGLNNGLSLEHCVPLEMVKVANTPQELVLEGDLIINKTYWNEPLLVTHTDAQGNLMTYVRTSSGGETISINKLNITAIYTPNQDKTQYTEQWRVK